MPNYKIPTMAKMAKVRKNEVYLVASGDLRLSANQQCWAAQAEMEKALADAVSACGYKLVRAHAYKPKEKHGFIGSQREGMEVFAKIDPTAPLIVAEAVWQYTHHVLSGLMAHQGPLLTVANWSGTWPGLVGMLNLNGSLTKAGTKYSTLWSEDFTDPEFRRQAQAVAGPRANPPPHRSRDAAGEGQNRCAGTETGPSPRGTTPSREGHHGHVR